LQIKEKLTVEEKELDSIHGEIKACLMGKSVFSKHILESILEDITQKIKDIKKELAKVEAELSDTLFAMKFNINAVNMYPCGIHTNLPRWKQRKCFFQNWCAVLS